MKNIELLAPSGNWEAMVAAVQNGADAVYIGGVLFNARQAAGNFTDEELIKAVEYCHVYNVKVYITLNVLIKQSELEEATHFISMLAKIHIDGIIVQDIGIAKVIREHYSDLPIHASTQMTIHNSDGVLELQDMGFNRIVLSRELSLDEITMISKNTTVHLEAFIHGALCTSYSGQCLMSSIIGSRSGNRGRCAQPCRLKYALLDHKDKEIAKKGYLLSTKDLCTITFLKDIINAGVKSLKVEGRSKRPEYVAIVIYQYRKALDLLLEKRDGVIDQADYHELLKIFNRGEFTSGYYYGTIENELLFHERPNHFGIYIGGVQRIVKAGKKGEVQLSDTLKKGDGIEFRGLYADHSGLNVAFIEKNNKTVESGKKDEIVCIPITTTTSPGDKIYKTTDISLLQKAKQSYHDETKKRIPLNGEITLRISQMPRLMIYDDDGNKTTVKLPDLLQAALHVCLKEDIVHKQLEKMGGTPFCLRHLTIKMDADIWISLKDLNTLRREATDEIIKKRMYRNPIVQNENDTNVPLSIISSDVCDYKGERPQLCVQVNSLEAAHVSMQNGADLVYYAPINYDSANLVKINDLQKYRGSKQLVFVLPPITRNQDLQFLDTLLKQYSHLFDGICIGHIGALRLAKKYFPESIIGDHTMNVMNRQSSLAYKDRGIKRITLSQELTLNEIHDIIILDDGEYEVIIHGRIPMMYLQHCPIKANLKMDITRSKCEFCNNRTQLFHLKDRLELKFPLYRYRIQECITMILNSKTLFMAENYKQLKKLNAKTFRLMFFDENINEITNIVQLYRDILDEKSQTDESLIVIQDMIRKGITYGHFFRSVE